MNGWKPAWALARFGWARDWAGMVITLLFAMYIGTVAGFSLDELIREDRPVSVVFGLIDWMYLMVFPCFGMLMNRTAFGIRKEDVYTKKIAHWRAMGITVPTIVKARLLHAIIVIPLIGLAFLLLQYGISPALREKFGLIRWLSVGLLWVCYALAVNTILIWMELGLSGKRFVWYYWGFMAACLIAAGVFAYGGINLVLITLHQMGAGHYYWLPAGLLAAAAAFWAGYKVILIKMTKRSYVF